MKKITTKKRKKKQQVQPKVPTHFIISVIMPCVMLACKDKFKCTQEELNDLAHRVERYISYIADGSVTVEELKSLIEVRYEKSWHHNL